MNVRGHETKRTWLIKILSPILFAAPEVHLKSLEKMWIDKTIKAVPWKAFVGKLEREWAEFILYVSNQLITHPQTRGNIERLRQRYC
jgi:hypothetical protein